MKAPGGIYVHLPYCRSRCGYCAFVVSTDDSSRADYLRALRREIALVAGEAAGETFDSVYLGGGTPSWVPPAELGLLLDSIRSAFALQTGAEVTLEANPDDVTLEAASQWRRSGASRVSVGVQSLADEELRRVGRRHDSAMALRALEILRCSGFSVSADLILGLPGQTRETFRRSAERLCVAGIDHVSVYLLETDKSKSLEEDRRINPECYLSDDAQADAWLELCQTLASSRFEHYEISNWARPGRQARHNLKYWRRDPTLGLGVSAHELWRERRRANVSGLPQYVAALAGGRRPTALDLLVSAEEQARERIVLGLRLAEGVGSSEFEGWIAGSTDLALPQDYRCWKEEGLLAERDGRVSFTERGFLLSNEILCRFV